MNDDTGGTKSVTPPLLTASEADLLLSDLRGQNPNPPRYFALRAIAEGRAKVVPTDSVDGAVTSKTVPHELSVVSSVAERHNPSAIGTTLDGSNLLRAAMELGRVMDEKQKRGGPAELNGRYNAAKGWLLREYRAATEGPK